MNETLNKEIKFILDRLFDNWDNDRVGWCSKALIFTLDKLLWNYHKAYAKHLLKPLQTNKGWWFMELAAMIPLVQYTRDAVEILVDCAKSINHSTFTASGTLNDLYNKALEKFYEEISKGV